MDGLFSVFQMKVCQSRLCFCQPRLDPVRQTASRQKSASMDRAMMLLHGNRAQGSARIEAQLHLSIQQLLLSVRKGTRSQRTSGCCSSTHILMSSERPYVMVFSCVLAERHWLQRTALLFCLVPRPRSSSSPSSGRESWQV